MFAPPRSFIIRFIFCFGILTIVSPSLWSAAIDERAGTEAFPFLHRFSNAITASWSGACAAQCEGLSALGVNPAGLEKLKSSRELQVGISQDFIGIKAGSFAYAFPGPDSSQMAFSAAFLGYGSIDELDEEGTFTGKQHAPASVTSSLSYATEIQERLRAGITIKGVAEYLGDFEESHPAVGWGIDAGVQYQPKIKALGFGASIRNLGRQEQSYFGESNDNALLPVTVQGGVYYYISRFRNTRLSADLLVPWHSLSMLSVGWEYNYNPFFTIRAGTRFNRYEITHLFEKLSGNADGDFTGGNALKGSGGFSFKGPRLSLNYSVEYWRNLSWIHSLTLGYPIKVL